MELTVNGKALELSSHVNAQDLIVQLGYHDQRIALEVNEVIIPKSKHAEFILSESDKVEVIRAVGGG